MKYVFIIVCLIVSFRTLTFARFNWGNNNKRAAVGSVALALFTIAGPLILMFTERL
jgi:hypothetical protein